MSSGPFGGVKPPTFGGGGSSTVTIPNSPRGIPVNLPYVSAGGGPGGRQTGITSPATPWWKRALTSDQGLNAIAGGLAAGGSYLAGKSAEEAAARSQEQALLTSQADLSRWQQQQDTARAQAGLEATQMDPLAMQKAIARAAATRALAVNGPASASPMNANGQLSNTVNFGPTMEQYLGDDQMLNSLENFESGRAQINPMGKPLDLTRTGLTGNTAGGNANVEAARVAALEQLQGREATQNSALQQALATLEKRQSGGQQVKSGGGKRGFLGKLLGVASPFLAMIPGAGIPLAAGAAAASAKLSGGSALDAALAGGSAGAGGYLMNRGRK